MTAKVTRIPASIPESIYQDTAPRFDSAFESGQVFDASALKVYQRLTSPHIPIINADTASNHFAVSRTSFLAKAVWLLRYILMSVLYHALLNLKKIESYRASII